MSHQNKNTSKSRAFTIVELLIVIVVIGILAAITIVAYNGIQNRARVSAASSALTQAVKKITIAMNDGTLSSFPNSQAEFDSLGLPNTASYQYSLTNTNGTAGYCITATVGPTSYRITNTSSPEPTSCPGHGSGGVAAVTNYALNPNADGSSISAFGVAGSAAPANRSIASDRSHSGSTSLKVIITGSGQIGAQMKVPLSTLRINPGEKVSWSFWVYSTKAGNIIPYIDGSRVSDGTYAGGASTSVSVPANTWTKVTATYTSLNDIYISQIGGYNLSVVSGDVLWFDEYMITKTDTVQNFADGNSDNWVWNGTPHNATSTGPAI